MTQLITNTSPLNPKQEQLLGLILAGGDWKDSLSICGYSEETRRSDVLKSPAFKKAFMDGLEMQMLSNGGKAVKALEDAIDNPVALGTREKVKVATEFLDRIGLGKVDRVQHEVEVTSALFILPPKQEDLAGDDYEVVDVTPT